MAYSENEPMSSAKEPGYFRKRFDRLAKYYPHNPLTRWVGASEMGVIRGLLPPPKLRGETTALDFGCGTGRIANLLFKAGYKTTGYDLSPAMVAQAQAAYGKRSNIRFTDDIKTVQGPWAVVTALGVLDYYPDSTPLWEEWKRLVQPGGTLVVTAPNANSPLARIYTTLSRFTCQAHAATFENLATIAQSSNFAPLDVRFAFPSRWWGHTMVMTFRAN